MSDFSASNLYCGEDADAVSSWDVDTWTAPPSDQTFDSSDHDDHWISFLFDSEVHHIPEPDYLRRFHDRSMDATARQDAISWILKVQAHYRFRPVTAYLSVNYLDRFLSTYTLPRGNGWPFQLLSVACLSIAAKMEETYAPLLLDLQLFESKFVFESRTIRRMELLVMANLKWRLRSVTPFDFIDYFARKLVSFGPSRISSRASDLILNTHRAIDFLGYLPSTVAAAAVICAGGEIADLSAGDDLKSASLHKSLNQEMVSRCQQLMVEYLIDTCPSGRGKGGSVSTPQSPAGVLDAAACGSCETQKSASGCPEPSRSEPPSKRRKLQHTEADGGD